MGRYSGTLNRVGSGGDGGPMGGVIRSVVEIDSKRLRNVWTSDFMDSYLDVGDEVTLSLGSAIASKWLLAIRKDDDVVREGFARFFLVNFTFLFVLSLLGLFVFHLFDSAIAASVICAYTLYILTLNIKAYVSV